MSKDNYKGLRYCLYARKSQEREDRQVSSIESQLRELKSYARKQGIRIVKIYQDSASAHKRNNRKGFNNMIEAIENGSIDAILVWKTDRLARNMIEGGAVIHFLEKGIIKRIDTPHKYHLPQDNSLLLTLEFGMANQFSRDLSKNIRRGNKTKVEKGGFCSKAPLGYKNCKETKTIIKDPVKFDKIKQLFEWYLSKSYSIAQLSEKCAKELELVGAKSEKPLTTSTIHRILSNPFYYGKVYCGELSNWGNHEPMLSLSQFKKVQQILRSTGRLAMTNCDFEYTSLMKCGECGRAITAEQKVKYRCSKCNKKHTSRHTKVCTCGYQIKPKDISSGKHYVYYRCSKSVVCSQKFINSKDLEGEFESFIASVALNKSFLEWSKTELQKIKTERHTEQYKQELENTRKQEALEKKMDVLIEMRLNKEIDLTTFQKKQQQIELDIEKCSQSIEKKDVINYIIDEIKWLSQLKKHFANASKKEKRTLLKKLSSNFVLRDRKLLVEAKKHYLILQELQSLQNTIFEPTKSRSQSSLNGSNKTLHSLWYTLANAYETLLRED